MSDEQGDIFNLVDCLLEPATLLTQLYTARLYTASTVVLVLQSMYYNYMYSWWKYQRIQHNQGDEEEETLLKLPKPADSGIPIPDDTRITLRHREFYYLSARSLAPSSTPPTWSYMRTSRSGPSATGFDDGSSSEDEVRSSFGSQIL
ncbi:hypothetical protein U1Q18_011679 [Sarracenia purpurea var. burkii]